MSKPFKPIFEEKPYYMTAMGMMGARFFEGNDGSGNDGKPGGEDSGDGSNNEAPGEGKPGDGKPGDGKPADGKPADGEPAGDEGKGEGELGEGGKRALEAERTARKKADSALAERDATIVERDATIASKDTEIEELTKKATASESAKDAEISVLKLALETGLRDKEDLALLASITDTEKREALAKRLATKAPGSSPVTPSGTSGDDDKNPSGGSVAAGREMFQKSKPKKKVGA
ncbi:hypothetical protein [Glutamicibacter arilaitensis]|uniref:hypothetical protein n=1 Tax=Glutamicibacter arilaitensis TaxID=256701 RepID=UPI003FD06FCB